MLRPHRILRLLLVLCGTLLAQCTNERPAIAATQILLRIDSAEPALRERIETLHVALYTQRDGVWMEGSHGDYPAPLRWPVDLAVLPRSGDPLEQPFEVIVEARAGDETFARTRAITHFVEGRIAILSLWLRSCRGSADEPLCGAEECHGEGCRYCADDGCSASRPIDPRTLPEWRGPQPPGDPLDGGVATDSGVGKEGGRDGGPVGSEAGANGPDGAPPDADGEPDGGEAAVAGPEPEAGVVPVDSSCSEEGFTRCVRAGARERERCVDGAFEPDAPCAEGEVCEGAPSAPAACRKLATVCVGLAQEVTCEGELMVFCDGKGGATRSSPCKSAAHCEGGKAAGSCVTCLPNEHRCTGATLEVCAPDGQSFTTKMACSSALLCNAAAGTCTAGCTAGSRTCMGDELLVCSDGVAFTREKSCAARLCDTAGQQCDTCLAGTKSCVGNMVQTCSADGQTTSLSACAAPRNLCTGNGTCVACTATQPCPASTNPCVTTTCNVATGSCEQVAKVSGTPCAGGFCDGAGKCGECVHGDSESCGSDVGECAFGQRTCANGIWGACVGGTSRANETCNGRDDDCDGMTDDQVSCPAGQSCNGGRCQSLCKNRVKDPGEPCDPTAPGYTTFTCTSDCRARILYNLCTPDPNDVLAPGPNCKANEWCGAYGPSGTNYCIPFADSPAGCPAIEGYSWVTAGGSGRECLLPCSPGRAGDCPSIVPTCVENPFTDTPAGWCSR